MLLVRAEGVADGTIAPANTPAGPGTCAAPAGAQQPLSSYQLMLAHIVGGNYVSPNTLGRPGSPGTPPTQRGRSFTPCLLATPAGAHNHSKSSAAMPVLTVRPVPHWGVSAWCNPHARHSLMHWFPNLHSCMPDWGVSTMTRGMLQHGRQCWKQFSMDARNWSTC